MDRYTIMAPYMDLGLGQLCRILRHLIESDTQQGNRFIEHDT